MVDEPESNVVRFRRSLEREEAIQIIRSALLETGQRLGWTDHVWDQMRDRGIVNSQVLTVLEAGDVVKGPTWDDEYQDWVCIMKKFVAGRSVQVVLGIHAVRGEVTIVTAY